MDGELRRGGGGGGGSGGGSVGVVEGEREARFSGEDRDRVGGRQRVVCGGRSGAEREHIHPFLGFQSHSCAGLLLFMAILRVDELRWLKLVQILYMII